MGQEIEYKLRAESEAELFAVFERLKAGARVSEVRTIAMYTRYLDTADRALRRSRATLRIRQENDKQVLTVKTPGINHSRGEWNLQRCCDTPFPQEQELAALVSDGAPSVIMGLPALEVTCEARFTRTCCMLTLPDGTRIELAADVGILAGKTEQLPLCELELELYGGSADHLEALAQEAGLSEEALSKHTRAMRLL